MRITAGRISVDCQTSKDVIDVCRVLGTEPWTDHEIDMYERLTASGMASSDAMRRVDEAKHRRAS